MFVLRCVIGSILLAPLAGVVRADADRLVPATDAFRAGMRAGDPSRAAVSFRKAGDEYETLRQQGAQNRDLFLNQGNAYLLADDLPRAILAYRRGLRLAPGDRELRANLEYARAQVAYPALPRFGRPADAQWPAWLPVPSASFCLWSVLLFYALACVGLTRWTMTRKARPLTLAAAAFALAGLLGLFVLAEVRQRRQEADGPLVVLAHDDVFLRVGNGRLYPPRYDVPLHRGVEARLLHERSDWLQIELERGEVGWVPRKEVLLDTWQHAKGKSLANPSPAILQ